LVQKLKEKGIKNGFALVGGTKAWKDAGYPMEKSQ
jgi:rhodanese-related sulfurtransferase